MRSSRSSRRVRTPLRSRLRLEHLESRLAPAFVAPLAYDVGLLPRVAVGDFNGDGVPDIVTANYGSGGGVNSDVSVLLGNGDGTFQPARTFPVGRTPDAIAVGDFTHDGNLDIVTANQDDNT